MTHAAFDKDQLRTKHLGSRTRHSTMYAEFSGFVACRRHHASRIGVPHCHRLAAQLRMVTLLHGRKNASISIWMILRLVTLTNVGSEVLMAKEY